MEDNGYAYDALDRLIADTIDAGPPIDYAYDLNDNRLSRDEGVSAEALASVYEYAPGSNRLVRVAQRQTGARPLAPKPAGRELVFNDAGRLFRLLVDGLPAAEYVYNDEGQRIRKTVLDATGAPLETTIFHYDAMGYLISETTETGEPVRDYLWLEGMVPVAQIDAVAGGAERISYLHTDHLMTNRLATDTAGSVVWRWEGEAFGETAAQELTGVTVNLRFPGQYFDGESGLYYNWNRYYDPGLGRYITSDPIGLRAGADTYGYTNQNPIVGVDPKGLSGSKPGGPYHPPKGVKTKCRPSDKCPEIRGKLWLLGRMIASHQGWDWVMPKPRGGNRHKQEIADLWVQFAECTALFYSKCIKDCKEKPKLPRSSPAGPLMIWELLRKMCEESHPGACNPFSSRQPIFPDA